MFVLVDGAVRQYNVLNDSADLVAITITRWVQDETGKTVSIAPRVFSVDPARFLGSRLETIDEANLQLQEGQGGVTLAVDEHWLNRDIIETTSVVSMGSTLISPSSATFFDNNFANDAADELITLFLGDAEIKAYCSASITSESMSQERFQRNVRRLLNRFSFDLADEASSEEQKAAVKLIRIKSRYVAYHLCRHIGIGGQDHAFSRELQDRSEVEKALRVDQFLKSLNGPDKPGDVRPVSEADGTASDLETSDLEDGSPDFPVLSELSRVKKFLINSTAFNKFRENLHHFVFPAYDLRSTLNRLVSTLSESTDLSSSWNTRLKSIITDLDLVSPGSVKISFQNKSTRMVDHLKLFLEARTGWRWKWWPLDPPIPPDIAGLARLEWKCVSSTILNSFVPPAKCLSSPIQSVMRRRLFRFHSLDFRQSTSASFEAA